jgi:hypothetical protein
MNAGLRQFSFALTNGLMSLPPTDKEKEFDAIRTRMDADEWD